MIPLEAFRDIVLDPRLRNTPVILETPSYLPSLKIDSSNQSGGIAALETQRRYTELDFFIKALRYDSREWFKHKQGLMEEYKEKKAEIEKEIYVCVRKLDSHLKERIVKYRNAARGDEARSRFFRQSQVVQREEPGPDRDIGMPFGYHTMEMVDEKFDIKDEKSSQSCH